MGKTLGGIVLCGGRSTRMGTPKAWLTFSNETLLQRVVRIVREACDPVVVVAALGQELPPLPADVHIARDAAEGEGPLAGLLAGLEFMGDQADAVFLTACDMPFLTAEFIREVESKLKPDTLAAVPFVDGFFHPLAGVFRIGSGTRVMEIAAEMLARGERKLQLLFDYIPTVRVRVADVRPLRNLNTPEEYAESIS